MRRLADRRVVHVEVAADGADDHSPEFTPTRMWSGTPAVRCTSSAYRLTDGVEELSRRLGVPVGRAFHGALEVGEEHRHQLAFAFESTPGGQDLLDQVPGRAGLRGVESRRGREPRGVRTLGAELRRGRQGPTALGAGSGPAAWRIPRRTSRPRRSHAGTGDTSWTRNSLPRCVSLLPSPRRATLPSQ
jgi:hypothetical protein